MQPRSREGAEGYFPLSADDAERAERAEGLL